MACAKEGRSDDESYSDEGYGNEEMDTNCGDESWESDTDLSGADNKVSSSSSDSDDDDETRKPKRRTREPCKYYNQSHCKDGKNCKYLHICQYFFKGHCKYGSQCKYRHDQHDQPAGAKNRSQKHKRPYGKNYQWQLSNGQHWSDIDNDWIIEAQYSLPEVKGMRIYNTKHGAVCIDFINMRIRGKSLRVRRKTFQSKDADNKWLWYFRADSNWKEYDGKDSKGNSIPATSAAIERQYQQNRRGSYHFTISQKSYNINFREMVQLNLQSNTRRKVRRRPAFTLPKNDGNSISGNFSALNLSGKHIWQFKGSHGDWHEFKKTNGGSSVSSDDIEVSYKQNSQGSITFSIGSAQYQVNFSTMIQTNLTTKRTRKVRRL